MSAKQWIGIGVTLAVVAGVHLCVYLTHNRLDKLAEPELFSMFPELEEAFSRYVDSVEQAERTNMHTYQRYQTTDVVLQPFDPNTADSMLLVKVGFKPFMAKNLIRYRKAGKIFRRAADLQKLYGMTDSLYATLEPYVSIDTLLADSLFRSRHAMDSSRYAHAALDSTSRRLSDHVKKDTVLELNTADTASLQYLRGIGRYTAICIIRYRQQLGGFVSTEQLREIAQIPGDRVDSLMQHLTVDASLVTPLPVNRSSVKRLYNHPYISYKQAEQIYDLRRRRIRLQSIEDLSGIFTPDELTRLTPYLSFE